MLVILGSINIDLVFEVERLPAAGETVLCPGYRRVPGGKGANQAVAAARAGAEVRFFGRVGEDDAGRLAVRSLARAGVDVGGILPSGRPTGTAVIGVDPRGENAIIVASGANLEVTSLQVPPELLGRGSTVLCQNEVPVGETLALLGRARAAGARTVLNLAPATVLPLADLRGLDFLVLNEAEAAALTGCGEPRTAAAGLHDHIGATVVVTLGARGVLAATAEGRYLVPAPAVRVVDTTGAGDAFVGVLAAALDLGAGPEEALRWASVAGGLACEALGAQSAIPDRVAIEARLDELGPTRFLAGV
jgi:ribokinase